MNYRMNRENIEKLGNLLDGYFLWSYVGVDSPDNDRDGYAICLITVEYLLCMMDGNGTPIFILDPSQTAYDDKSLQYIASAFIRRSGWKKFLDENRRNYR